jgi:small subunit ribosomal protein S11
MSKVVAARTRKKTKRVVTTGAVHVLATFNNTHITVTDPQGNVIAWRKAGGEFKGSVPVHPMLHKWQLERLFRWPKNLV